MLVEKLMLEEAVEIVELVVELAIKKLKSLYSPVMQAVRIAVSSVSHQLNDDRNADLQRST